jgi:hypothetical protein
MGRDYGILQVRDWLMSGRHFSAQGSVWCCSKCFGWIARGAFYKGEGLRLMEASDVPHYLTHCEVRSTFLGGQWCPCT